MRSPLRSGSTKTIPYDRAMERHFSKLRRQQVRGYPYDTTASSLLLPAASVLYIEPNSHRSRTKMLSKSALCWYRYRMISLSCGRAMWCEVIGVDAKDIGGGTIDENMKRMRREHCRGCSLADCRTTRLDARRKAPESILRYCRIWKKLKHSCCPSRLTYSVRAFRAALRL